MAASPKSSDNEKRVCDDLSKGEDPCKANFCSGSHHCDLSQKKIQKKMKIKMVISRLTLIFAIFVEILE